MRKVVVGLSRAANAIDALRWAVQRAAESAAQLHVVTAVPIPIPIVGPVGTMGVMPDRDRLVRAARAEQAAVLRRVLDEASQVPSMVSSITVGDPFRVLRSAAADADLVVLGPTHHRVWSLPTRLARRLGCPVVTVVGDRPQ